ncbi:MAG: hypothetical protein PHY48_12710 [Candidatus Cloacimonetes bacterium]|nr:hypothetical protein [Candidatus Cloacimonadota bacterium]
MKVVFNYGLAGYSGKLMDLVYYMDKTEGRVCARRYRYPRLTQENERVGRTSEQLFAILPSNAYKDNLRLYLMRYNCLKNTPKPLRSWVNLYIHLMHNMAKAMPEVDLTTITREQIYAQDLPCISIKRAVEAGLLPEVSGYERMEGEI